MGRGRGLEGLLSHAACRSSFFCFPVYPRVLTNRPSREQAARASLADPSRPFTPADVGRHPLGCASPAGEWNPLSRLFVGRRCSLLCSTLQQPLTASDTQPLAHRSSCQRRGAWERAGAAGSAACGPRVPPQAADVAPRPAAAPPGLQRRGQAPAGAAGSGRAAPGWQPRPLAQRPQPSRAAASAPRAESFVSAERPCVPGAVGGTRAGRGRLDRCRRADGGRLRRSGGLVVCRGLSRAEGPVAGRGGPEGVGGSFDRPAGPWREPRGPLGSAEPQPGERPAPRRARGARRRAGDRRGRALPGDQGCLCRGGASSLRGGPRRRLLVRSPHRPDGEGGPQGQRHRACSAGRNRLAFSCLS